MAKHFVGLTVVVELSVRLDILIRRETRIHVRGEAGTGVYASDHVCGWNRAGAGVR